MVHTHIGLIQVLDEICNADIRQDPSINFGNQLSLLGAFVKRIPRNAHYPLLQASLALKILAALHDIINVGATRVGRKSLNLLFERIVLFTTVYQHGGFFGKDKAYKSKGRRLSWTNGPSEFDGRLRFLPLVRK